MNNQLEYFDNKNRIIWIDFAKGIGILLMIIGHANINTVLKTWIYSFHMPLFFIISGITNGLSKKYVNDSFSTYLIRKLKKYIVPYFVFWGLNFLVSIVYLIITNTICKQRIVEYVIYGALFSNDNFMPNCAPIWFLTCLFVAEIYFYFMIKIKKKYLLICSMFLQILFLKVIVYVEQQTGIFELPWHIDVALLACVFLIIGEFYQNKSMELFDAKRINLIGIMNDKINMVANEYQNIVLFMVSACLLSICLLNIIKNYKNTQRLWYRIVCFWGENSIVFLGTNYFINVIVRIIFSRCGIDNGIIYSIVDVVCVLVATSVIIMFINELKTYKKGIKRFNCNERNKILGS